MNKDSELLIRAANEMKILIDLHNAHLMSNVRSDQESPPDLWDGQTCQELWELAYEGTKPKNLLGIASMLNNSASGKLADHRAKGYYLSNINHDGEMVLKFDGEMVAKTKKPKKDEVVE